MDSEAVKKGMQLADAYNPIFGTVTSYCRSIVAGVLKSAKNKPITNMNVSFLSNPGQLSLPLVEGTYLFVQPLREEETFSFNNVVFDKPTGRFLMDEKPLERNYMAMRIKASNPL